MDIAKSFTYIFDDEKWIGKIGIGVAATLLSFLIIPIFLIPGWLAATTRNVMDGKEHPLADWDDWGQLLKDGFSIVIASLVYSAPFIILFIIAFIATIGFGGLSEVSEEAAAVGLFATWGIVMCVGAIMGLALLIISPIITIQYVRTNELAACFRFGEIIQLIQDNLGDVFLLAIIPFGIGLVVSFITVIPCIGWIVGLVVAPYQSAVLGHLYGQFANKLDGKGSKFDSFDSGLT
ncbi:MAG: DUF4013 domain-containing protein [Chloroflexota bacterium]